MTIADIVVYCVVENGWIFIPTIQHSITMSDTEETIRAFNVHYEDEKLEVEDFKTLTAENAEEARNAFTAEHLKEEHQEIQEVEEAFEISAGLARELLGVEIEFSF